MAVVVDRPLCVPAAQISVSLIALNVAVQLGRGASSAGKNTLYRSCNLVGTMASSLVATWSVGSPDAVEAAYRAVAGAAAIGMAVAAFLFIYLVPPPPAAPDPTAAAQGLREPRLFANLTLVIRIAISSSVQLAAPAIKAHFVFHFIEHLGGTPTELGWVTAGGTALGFASIWGQGWLVDRYGPGAVLAVVYAASAGLSAGLAAARTPLAAGCIMIAARALLHGQSVANSVWLSEAAGPNPDVKTSGFALAKVLSGAFGTAGLRGFGALAERSSTELMFRYCGVVYLGNAIAAALAGAPARMKLTGKQL